jgi:hypothetical protein
MGLMLWCISAFGLNTAVCLKILRSWREGIAVLGLCINYTLQSVSLAAMCVAGMLGYLDFFGNYAMMTERAPAVFLALTVASWAAIAVFLLFNLFKGGSDTTHDTEAIRIDEDPQLRAVLILAAAFSVLFWVGSSLNFGVLRSVLQVFQRAFLLVPLIAGIHYRASRLATATWCAVLLINLAVGIGTGSRSPAFAPLAFFAIGVVLGAAKKVRWRIILVVFAMAIPLGYIFGIMEVVRGEVGYIRASDISLESIANVREAIREKRPGQIDEYDALPAWVRTCWRLVTWPTYVVASAAAPPYRGFDDIWTQIVSSANIVTFTRQTDENSEEELFNVRARDYGFLVNEGTNVEFGLVAESWDRGGPVAAFGYCLLTVAILAGLEMAIRRLLAHRPAFAAVAISVLGAASFWTLNIYNLPLSLRILMVNLAFCAFLLGLVAVFVPPGNSRKRPGG